MLHLQKSFSTYCVFKVAGPYGNGLSTSAKRTTPSICQSQLSWNLFLLESYSPVIFIWKTKFVHEDYYLWYSELETCYHNIEAPVLPSGHDRIMVSSLHYGHSNPSSNMGQRNSRNMYTHVFLRVIFKPLCPLEKPWTGWIMHTFLNEPPPYYPIWQVSWTASATRQQNTRPQLLVCYSLRSNLSLWPTNVGLVMPWIRRLTNDKRIQDSRCFCNK